MNQQIVLVKHAQPVLDQTVPPRQWRLGREGEEQAARLAERLEPFAPFTLVSSREPKARQTADVVSRVRGLHTEIVEGLEEIDRPALPLMSIEERERFNARIFEKPLEPVVGRESAAEALARFRQGIARAIARAPEGGNVVIITHGTVMALFVAAHNDIDAMTLWKRLECGSFVVLARSGFQLLAGYPGAE